MKERWWADFYGTLLLSAKCPTADGKLLTKDDLENHSKGQSFRLVHWLNIIWFQREIYQDFINLARNYYLVSFLGVN